MKILVASSEITPLARTGGLADAVSELTAELIRLGHEVSVVIPFYRSIREGKLAKTKKTRIRFNVQVGNAGIPGEVFETRTPDGVQVFLVARDEYFDRSGFYGVDGRDYQDNAARFIYFTKCVIELASRMDPAPQILHANGWQTALLPVLVSERRLPVRTVLTPHTLAYQGNFWSYDFALTNLPGDYFSAHGVEYYGSMNCLKGGILFANAVILPGERYVCEAQSPEHGCGLENVLREHQHKLYGIPSNAELRDWKPAAGEDFEKSRKTLLDAVGMAPEPPRAIFTTFTESSGGKGLDLLFPALDRLLADNVRLILVGSVDPKNITALEIAERKHRGRFAHVPEADEAFAHKALAGADVFLVPGPVEPEAIWLRRAMLSGAIPLAAQCPGLFQFVRDWEQTRGEGNGFVFCAPTVDGLLDGCRKALRVMHADYRQTLRTRCLSADFSLEAAARAHIELFERLLDSRKTSLAA
ncbi:MAG TPA: glycogen/starch synthase [Terrimicrobiaceae bacterium]